MSEHDPSINGPSTVAEAMAEVDYEAEQVAGAVSHWAAVTGGDGRCTVMATGLGSSVSLPRRPCAEASLLAASASRSSTSA